jgi:hypothetical protein
MSPRPAAVRSRQPIAPAGLLLSLVLAGCSVLTTTAPAPTPADFQGIASEIAKRGIRLDRLVSGDAGCDDPVLGPTAISFDASGFDQDETARLYLYIFRNRDSFNRLRSSIDECARSYVSDPATFESIESSPFVLAGQGPWGAEFEGLLRDALTEASGTGN